MREQDFFMLSFVWVKAGSTIKSGGRIFIFPTSKGRHTHTGQQPGFFYRRHEKTGTKAGAINHV
jgi:hypothetical protein